MSTIGVGIIGAAVGGWASIGHIPALKALPNYELRAISTTRRESADRAAKAFDVEAAFDNHHDLIAHPGVDLVVVSVKVTQHLELVSAALAAGKMVYSEWPLGNGVAEATELAARAEAAGVRTVVGLQGRFAPEVQHARELIRSGYLGTVLGSTLVGSGMVWGGEVATRSQAYWFDNANGATPLTSPTLHALDALQFTLGEFASVTANLVNGRQEARLVDDGSLIPVTTPDQVAIIGTLAGGAGVSAFYRGGSSRGNNLRWEINGSEGDLVLSSAWGNLQVADLLLEGGRGSDAQVAAIQPPNADDLPEELKGPPRNVARLYRQLARDLETGTRTVPDFAAALDRHRLIDAVERASATGARQTLTPPA